VNRLFRRRGNSESAFRLKNTRELRLGIGTRRIKKRRRKKFKLRNEGQAQTLVNSRS
jgi:hypothetical protein